ARADGTAVKRGRVGRCHPLSPLMVQQCKSLSNTLRLFAFKILSYLNNSNIDNNHPPNQPLTTHYSTILHQPALGIGAGTGARLRPAGV
ncbi:hypothetical protein, partial [Mucilaginibacter kameinonensis]|uniref:hypothetical protein n=1 Tax=Mucilaginibacter kameinonensis TaxID=452286 RepID=UPI001ABFAF43